MDDMRTKSSADLRILIVAEHASAKFGGEAALPLHYYRVLRRRKVPVWLLVHERTRSELEALYPQDGDRIHFIPDTAWQRFMWRTGRLLPARLASFTTGFAIRLATQLAQRKLIRGIVQRERITVIHQPIPVSPKEPSMIFGMGVPVIVGPMNGGMNYPAAFRGMEGGLERLAIAIGRSLSNAINRIIPGKRRAAVLLVANERTRAALPSGVRGRVVEFPENGVDLSLWKPANAAPRPSVSCARYVYMGRLPQLKAVDLLLIAFKRATARVSASLSIIGDGVERTKLEQLASDLDLRCSGVEAERGKVIFRGWLSQAECAEYLRNSDALVLPSLMECGGAVVLEAMAMEIPVIATAWGGPLDYIDGSCGVLVEPRSKDWFVDQLAATLVKLAESPEDRVAMGKAARTKVTKCFDWEVKVDQMLDIYRSTIASDSLKCVK